MKALKMVVHGLGLAGINLGSVLLGFAFYRVLRPASQLVAQLPVAVAVSIVGFVLWYQLSLVRLGDRARLRGWELVQVYLTALLWNPLIFVPLHYLGTGYVTAFSNVTAFWAFQLPVNAVALGFVHVLYTHGTRHQHLSTGPGAA